MSSDITQAQVALRMKSFLRILGISVLVLGILIYAAIGWQSWSSRFRVTVEVDTPTGVKRGSSVIELRTTRTSGFLMLSAMRGAITRLRGEAVFVDLGPSKDGKRQHLIALMTLGKNGKDQNFHRLFGRAFFTVNPHTGTMGYTGIAARLEDLPVGKKVTLKPPNMPTFVTFKDAQDHNSVVVIETDPASVSENDILSNFGDGFRLKAVTIERVSSGLGISGVFRFGGEPISNTIHEKLPWLNRRPVPWIVRRSAGNYVDARPRNKDKYQIQTNHFVRGR